MPLTCANALLFILILVGVGVRRRRTLHVFWMRACFVLDLALLAAVEFLGESAVMEAARRVSDAPEDPTMTLVHVTFAVGGLLAWILQLRLGSRILAGHEIARATHIRVGLAFLALRLGNVVTAFFVVG